MNRWDIEATRREIKRVHGSDQLALARSCLRSVSDRQFYARFHYQRAEQALRRYVRTHLNSKDFVSISLGVDEEEWNRFNVVVRKIGADLIACIQSLHSLPDILASAVYYSLRLNDRFQPEHGRYVNHAFVLKCLAGTPELGTVREHLRSATAGSGYKHLAALVNQAKHYSIAFPAVSADLVGSREEHYMLAFPQVKTARSTFPQVFVEEFLPPLHLQLARSVVLTGQALHETLSAA